MYYVDVNGANLTAHLFLFDFNLRSNFLELLWIFVIIKLHNQVSCCFGITVCPAFRLEECLDQSKTSGKFQEN